MSSFLRMRESEKRMRWRCRQKKSKERAPKKRDGALIKGSYSVREKVKRRKR